MIQHAKVALHKAAGDTVSMIREGAKPIVALTVIVTVALFPLLLGQFYLIGDTRDVFVPLEHFFHTEQLAGRLPTWNPDIAWGYPVIASAQIGFFYPPSLILRFLPLQTYLPVLLVSHLVFLTIGTYSFLRAQKRTEAASLLGALSFTLGSFIFQHLTHLNIMLTIAWLPWQFLAVHHATHTKQRRMRNVVLLATSIGLPFLAGQLHIPILMSIVTMTFFLQQRWRQHAPFRVSLINLVIVATLALGLAAAQLFPTAELLQQSSRGPAGDFNIAQANQHSFPLYHLPTLIFPRFFNNDSAYWGKRLQIEYGIFIGTIPLALAALAFTTRHHIAKQYRSSLWQLSFFRWLLVISFLLALGSLSPFRLIGIEPSLWFFSAPARWLMFTTFTLAVLAAAGYDQLQAMSHRLRRVAGSSAIILGLIAIFTTTLLYTVTPENIAQLSNTVAGSDQNHPGEYYSNKLASLLISARTSSASLASIYTAMPILALASLAVTSNTRRAILGITVVELLLIAATTNPFYPWEQILDPPPITIALPQDILSGQARLLSYQRPGDTGKYLTNPETRANATTRDEIRQGMVPLAGSIYGIPGAQWPASLTLAGHNQKLDSFSDATAAAGANVSTIIAASDASPPAIEVRTLNPAPRAEANNSIVEYQQVTPTKKTIVVKAEKDTTLIVRDSYYPGWQAAIDGAPVRISRAEDIFQSIEVPAGSHTVTMQYQPRTVQIGIGISSIAALICGILIFTKPVR